MTVERNLITTDPDRFRREAFRRVPGVVLTGEHLFRVGMRRDYYIDFDPLVNDPIECRHVVEWYADKINEILGTRPIDVLGFLEKDRDSGGTTGAVRLAGALSMVTGLPNLGIRLGKELPQERIKFRLRAPSPVSMSLAGYTFVLLSDHSTSGSEALRAADAVGFRGGKVTDYIVYSLVRPDFERAKFKERGIAVHNFLTAPDDLRALGFQIRQE